MSLKRFLLIVAAYMGIFLFLSAVNSLLGEFTITFICGIIVMASLILLLLWKKYNIKSQDLLP